MTDEVAVYQADSTDSVAGLKAHPWRKALYDELHSRPSPLIAGPCRVLQFTLLPTTTDSAVHEHLADLCQRFQLPRPHRQASCLYQDFGQFELRWERHSEFANFTFIFPAGNPFACDALARIPADWLQAMPGELVVATELMLVTAELSREQWQAWFEGERVAGAWVAEQKAKVWTAFKLHRGGFGRILVHNHGLSAYQCGRLVQRMLELETYRLMSLLALPMARTMGHELRLLEDNLASLNQKISDTHTEHDDRALLQELSLLAADVERRCSNTNYRFSATVAYHDLVNDRLNQLKEEALPNVQSLREFLQRRLTPGIKTCNSVRDRLDDISRRITRTTSLLQARVDLAIQEQNQGLLWSMNRRSQVQLRLQQTVEGLSVVAISYYLVSLLGIGFEGAQPLVPGLDAGLLKGIAAPVVLVLVYWGVRSVKKQITRPVAPAEESLPLAARQRGPHADE